MCMWQLLSACWTHTAEASAMPPAGHNGLLVGVLGRSMVYNHSAMYCPITCTHARFGIVSLGVCLVWHCWAAGAAVKCTTCSLGVVLVRTGCRWLPPVYVHWHHPGFLGVLGALEGDPSLLCWCCRGAKPSALHAMGPVPLAPSPPPVCAYVSPGVVRWGHTPGASIAAYTCCRCLQAQFQACTYGTPCSGAGLLLVF